MNYKPTPSMRFKRDLKKYRKDPKKLRDIKSWLNLLADGGCEAIHPKMRPHILKGNYKGTWECHI